MITIPKWICTTCGTQYPESPQAPDTCRICTEERQYVGHHGQQWITMEALKSTGHKNAFREHEPNLIGIGTVPEVGIGQRALLVRTPEGNILWDCLSYIDDITEEIIRGLGGISAIAISHPHYYSSMVEWADRFDCEIYLHEGDKQWVVNPSSRIRFWSGSRLPLTTEIELVHLGGHFDGGTVLHWSAGADARGALLTGDILQVVADRNWVSFMYSYPNLIPLPASAVLRIRDTISELNFDRLYGFRFEYLISTDAKQAVIRSAERYVEALRE